MIFLLNAKITEQRQVVSYRNNLEPHYPTHSRFDVFKYTLASYSVFDEITSKFIFYIELSEEFLNRKQELVQFLEENFSKEKTEIHWYRINLIKEWRVVCENISSIDDNVIFFAANDDHVFLDSSLDLLREGINLLKEEKDENSAVYYSHWIEGIRMANHFNGELIESGNFVKFNWYIYDAILLLRKERFFNYWNQYDDDGRIWFKPDAFLDYRGPFHSTFYIPTKEIVRHFDGYGHVGNFTNSTPPLTIPPWFFENNLKIKYGFDNRYEDSVNINPSINNLFSVDINGTDYKWLLEDIPLFWKKHISEILVNPLSNFTALKKHRNESFLQTTTSVNRAYLTDLNTAPPLEWFNNNIL